MRRLRLTPLRLTALLPAIALAFAGVAYAASLPLASAHLFASTQSLAKATCGSTTYDTWVNHASPTQNNGNAATVTIRNTAGSERYAFVRFDIGGCGLPRTAGADSATLTLDVTAATRTNHTISLYPVFTSWNETLNWNGLGGLTIASQPTASFTTTTGSHTLTVTGDLDNAIKAGAFWGWELVETAGSGNNTTTIASSENGTASSRPSLSLTVER
jgi:hypothetical protein